MTISSHMEVASEGDQSLASMQASRWMATAPAPDVAAAQMLPPSMPWCAAKGPVVSAVFESFKELLAISEARMP